MLYIKLSYPNKYLFNSIEMHEITNSTKTPTIFFFFFKKKNSNQIGYCLYLSLTHNIIILSCQVDIFYRVDLKISASPKK